MNDDDDEGWRGDPVNRWEETGRLFGFICAFVVLVALAAVYTRAW